MENIKNLFKTYMDSLGIPPISYCESCKIVYEDMLRTIQTNFSSHSVAIDTMQIAVNVYKKDILKMEEKIVMLIDALETYASDKEMFLVKEKLRKIEESGT